MLEEQRKRVERAISDMIDDMYRTFLRRMQCEMHLCAARCCDDKDGTLDTVQSCIAICADPLEKAQSYLQHELGQFQGRLQNCVMQCNDDVRHGTPTMETVSETELAKFRHQFERCTIECVDKHIGLIPNMMKSIKAVLAQGPEAKRKM